MVGRVVAWADEMRVGLRGMLRRVWAPRGVKVRQRVQLQYEWRYLFVLVDGLGGRVWWTWMQTMTSQDLLGAVGALPTQSEVAAVVWDRAPSHRALAAYDLGLPLIAQPPYAPELNPVERVIEELRRVVEGKVYPTIEEKVAAVEEELRKLDAAPERVRQLAGWDWIRDALTSLPVQYAA
jgi:hypothetical protein